MNRFFMLYVLCAVGAGTGVSVWAADPLQVYRCGNAYTNQPDPKGNCVPLRSAAITVIEGTKVQPSPTVATLPGVVASESKVDIGEQRQRDAQARAVLQTEWQRAQTRHQALLQEWNQGEPERRADEQRQPAKYQERVAQLRAALQRSEADLAGLQRELSRLSAPATGATP
ncbi:hypothetical protein [Limnohabitans sp. JirII-31]|uniref:hypothetical protein n=1 Tax=Limnohabitans sp. JirII-31 TaxID=1977908 RepID=UPI000C1DDCBC|nr:hypothetical protein [Limnohabitans sp. JirII-31]PIT80442.1 hypothetical protein B9Z41_00495 [Limnohabitans sp. JirII-31]